MINRNTRKTTEEFVAECKLIYGDNFNYDKINYIGNKSKVTITCPIHGDVEVIPIKFLKGHGCPLCNKSKGKNTRRLTTEDFIEKANKVHGSKYDYSKVDYINSHTKVCIICPQHGEFWQRPNDHLNGNGCSLCYKETYAKTHEEFLKGCENTIKKKYICNKTHYINNLTKITLYCEKHGYFKQLPKSFLAGDGCPQCKYESWRTTQEDFIAKCKEKHGDLYDYSQTVYRSAFLPINVICHKKDIHNQEHGIFSQMASHHVSGHGCPKCQTSIIESDIRFLLDANKIDYESHNRKLFKGIELDFYLPQYNIAIECQGIQHFKPIEFFGGEKTYQAQVERDEHKRQLCEEHGIKLLYYSNLGIEYPYKVYEDKEELLKEIV